MANITVEEIDTQLIKDIKIEDYSQPKTIDGVTISYIPLWKWLEQKHLSP